ncbi:hypothetical protein WH221_13360 [Chryseobacterium culicis]|uniref:Uncharacterized protein n=1 Tax=Chryseobacterium culicis TaxID=680127 RepID=A0A2S9CRG4_CHRCI|nr:hypothetical protein [Chryseobacterium culicis]PRB83113.1 hypothetical protein CQ022_13345 [Chryseobacterium culicis]PRB89355.1 hypothetical protein CQ033_12245 [Chryseobacterium culicis]
METIIQHQKPFQYAEAYISDMWMLKTIFLETQNVKKADQNFGLPFLLAKNGNIVVAFASLIINENNEISFKVYDKNTMPEVEKRNFFSRAERYLKNNNTPNFKDPEQLKSSISSMISWLNPE